MPDPMRLSASQTGLYYLAKATYHERSEALRNQMIRTLAPIFGELGLEAGEFQEGEDGAVFLQPMPVPGSEPPKLVVEGA